MGERVLTISLDKAKEWYNSNFTALKEIALQLYTKEELTGIKLPNSWEEYYNSRTKEEKEFIDNVLNHIGFNCKYPSMFKLELLRDCYRQGYKPNWLTNDVKYCLALVCNMPIKIGSTEQAYFLSFQSEEIRNLFYDNFKSLIIEAGDLI